MLRRSECKFAVHSDREDSVDSDSVDEVARVAEH